jgi:hypothetical protein
MAIGTKVSFVGIRLYALFIVLSFNVAFNTLRRLTRYDDHAQQQIETSAVDLALARVGAFDSTVSRRNGSNSTRDARQGEKPVIRSNDSIATVDRHTTPLIETEPAVDAKQISGTKRETTKPNEFDPTNYAYAYMISGCSHDDSRYLGFLYAILVGARILREEGARADIVAMIQMSSSTEANELPAEDVRLLTEMGIKVVYIPKQATGKDTMYDAVMDKFRILTLTQYRRVLIMDGDVMPIGNLDYLFAMSDGPNAILKENVVVMGTKEPANGGFYMLTPGEGEYEQLQEIVRIREELAANLTVWPKFDVVNGWGHAMDADDPWQCRDIHIGGTNWTFHFAFADQGLLYHWTKFVKRSVSILGFQSLQNWAFNATTGKTFREMELAHPFNETSHPRFHNFGLCLKYLCDFAHFTGGGKPWTHTPPSDLSSANFTHDDNPERVWWQTLAAIDRDLGMNLNFTNWQPRQPPLGAYAKYGDVERRINMRKAAQNKSSE